MKYVALILLSFCLCSCYNIERDCSNYKTGSFYSEIVIGDTIYKSNFIRTEKLQVESFRGSIDSSTVRWINDCEMIFKTINPKRMADKKEIHIKILTTTDSSYTFEYSYVGKSVKQRGVAFKVIN